MVSFPPPPVTVSAVVKSALAPLNAKVSFAALPVKESRPPPPDVIRVAVVAVILSSPVLPVTVAAPVTVIKPEFVPAANVKASAAVAPKLTAKAVV